MKKFKSIAVLLLALVIVSCGGEVKYNNTSFNDGQYSMDIPSYMESIALGNPDASMQYGNEMKGHFAMVIAESKESLLAAGLDYTVEEYAEFALEFLKKSLSSPKAERVDYEVKMINGLESVSYKVNGVFSEIDQDIFYYLTIFKNDNNYYSLSTWTTAGREKKYTPIMEKMINSFKEL